MNKLFIESIKCKDGEFCNLSYHQARMDRTLEHFRMDKMDLFQILEKESIPYAKETLKCRIVYGKKIESIEFTPYTILKKEKIGMVNADDIDYAYKYEDRSKLQKLIFNTGFDDILIIKNGFVTDALFSNLVFESDSGLFTPSSYLLPGTKRQSLLDFGKIEEQQITVSDIHSFQKVRFINAMIDLEDNVSFDISKINV